mmetsp:Transcript_78961/g.229324  ORF Transcript_78961/g.229324 Transcript_78961/m.229324 type:complete len:218 (+) Transcript_78961:3111-3764(+)
MRPRLEALGVRVGHTVEVRDAVLVLLAEVQDPAQIEHHIHAGGSQLQNVAIQLGSPRILLALLIALRKRNPPFDAVRVQPRQALEVPQGTVVVLRCFEDVAQQVKSLLVIGLHVQNPLEKLLCVGVILPLPLNPSKREQCLNIPHVLLVGALVPLVSTGEILHLRIREADVVEYLHAPGLVLQRRLEVLHGLVVGPPPQQLHALGIRVSGHTAPSAP